ncbi:MAG: hypothetical protein HY270_09290 [Deltaproteobacteria bacterium]|nr:hypothetical protein [Deltaproteobacteria bacterium]
MTQGAVWMWLRSSSGVAAAVGIMLAGAASAGATCVGDCNGDGEVTIDELITMVNIAAGPGELSTCSAADANGDGAVTIDEIIQAVNIALGGFCEDDFVCGNGFRGSLEECDDGGTCIGGSNAGTHCIAESDCHGNGVCVGGAKLGTACADSSACGAGGTCVHCVPQGGDGCAANCTTETTIRFDLVAGEPDPNDPLAIKPGTSGAVVHADILTIPLSITGTQNIVAGKPSSDGTIPFVIPAASVKFPIIPVGALACACIRAVPYKTCGGTIFDSDGALSPSCTPGFIGADDCKDKPPCTSVHGSGNSASGIVGCGSGLVGANVTLEQDSGGSSGTAGNVRITLAGIGAKGSAIVINSTAIGTVVGACDDAPAFCTDADEASLRGTPQTQPLTTDTACAVVHNANGHDGVDVGPFCATGVPFDCSRLTANPPSVCGAGLAGAFPAIDQPMLGDIIVTNQFFAQCGSIGINN